MDFHHHQQPYFAACMYDDYENINVDNCNHNSGVILNEYEGCGDLEHKRFNGNDNKNGLNVDHGHSVNVKDEQTTIVDNCPISRGGILASKNKNKSLNGVFGRAKQQKLKSSNKSCYKHVPHRDKPPHLVERRNARERRRVQAVNSAFARLRKSVPLENRNKRVSKVKTLQKAIEYINYLQDILQDDSDSRLASSNSRLNKENAAGGGVGGPNRWMCI